MPMVVPSIGYSAARPPSPTAVLPRLRLGRLAVLPRAHCRLRDHMAPYKNIVCGTDLSDPSDVALRQAFALAEAFGARLAIVHVATVHYGVGGGGAPIPPLSPLMDPEAFRKDADAQLQRQVERVQTGFQADLEVCIDSNSESAAIVRFAESREADLVVVGSKGATGLRRMLLGSVAESVVRHAPCSVLVARPSPSSSQVLAATDLSKSSLPALSAAHAAALRRNARLTVLHCMDFPPTMMAIGFAPMLPADPEDPNSRVAQMKQADLQVRSTLAGLGVTAEVLVEPGRARGVIPDAAEQLSAELVVVGTHGRTGLTRMLLGSVAESVVRHAPCSVLVVRAH
ncbi:MAG: universal stress protein [Planctomycetes bacterium]|nr:universal stress protein [Planctomycetota bacterium]